MSSQAVKAKTDCLAQECDRSLRHSSRAEIVVRRGFAD
jgi:hypothetical protein